MSATINRMPRAKRHHYVPQSHQRWFRVGATEGIWVYDKQSDTIARRAIKDTAVIGNYYTIATKDGPSDAIEKVLAEYENAAIPGLLRLVEADGDRFVIEPPDRMHISAYLALLHTRVPVSRSTAGQIAETLTSMQLGIEFGHAEGFPERARERGLTGTDEELEAMRRTMLEDLRSGAVRPVAPESMSLPQVFESAQAIAPYIDAMGWSLVRRHSLPRFILGDNPVSIWPTKSAPKWRGVGFASVDAEVSVPLSPQFALVMAHGRPNGWIFDEEDIRLPIDQVPWPYHYRTWALAQRWIYGASRADIEAIQYLQTSDERRRSYGGLAPIDPFWLGLGEEAG